MRAKITSLLTAPSGNVSPLADVTVPNTGAAVVASVAFVATAVSADVSALVVHFVKKTSYDVHCQQR